MFHNSNPTEPATITKFPADDRTALTGVQRVFKCTVKDNPSPMVTWYHNGEPLEGDSSISGNTVTIHSTKEKHSGMYQCFVTNANGVTFKSWTLQVRTPGRATMYDTRTT